VGNFDERQWGISASAVTVERYVFFGASVGSPSSQYAHSGNGVLYSVIRGFGPDGDREARTVEAAKAIRKVIADLGGTTVVEHAPLSIKSAIGVWGPTRRDFRLMQALKAQFDPKGTLNPGRYVGGI